ncbi:5-hydroxytryptamine receptor 6-like [Stylophora pistillata]|uniref:5-hydroxytryptamine receptor 6-like n=1 Tax=Stylophora pistillata TaxID=50429 RepID=UPI000C045FE1|nr:5-hydroxytryptamine receptor 6-like [Stylophora pistillata]
MWFFIVGWLFTALCVLENAFVIYLIITRPQLHVTANWFVVSLALADLCVGLSYFPLLFISSFFPSELSVDHSGLWFKISHTFLYSSTLNLCVMTADRYLGVTTPLKYLLRMTKKRLVYLISSAWITPLILFTLPCVFIYSSGNELFIFGFEMLRVSIFQLIPSILFIFVICRLCFIARDISRKESVLLAQIRFNFQPQLNVTRKKCKEKKASVNMIIFIILFFVLCHIGGNLRCFCYVFKTCTVSDSLKRIIHISFVANSAVNPLVYAVLKRDIKRELIKIYACSREINIF